MMALAAMPDGERGRPPLDIPFPNGDNCNP